MYDFEKRNKWVRPKKINGFDKEGLKNEYRNYFVNIFSATESWKNLPQAMNHGKFVINKFLKGSLAGFHCSAFGEGYEGFRIFEFTKGVHFNSMYESVSSIEPLYYDLGNGIQTKDELGTITPIAILNDVNTIYNNTTLFENLLSSLVECRITIEMNRIWRRQKFIPRINDENQIATLNNFLMRIRDGEIGIFLDKSIATAIDGEGADFITLPDGNNEPDWADYNRLITEILRLRGISYYPSTIASMKKANLIKDEVTRDDIFTGAPMEIVRQNNEIFCKKVNDFYGLENDKKISFELPLKTRSMEYEPNATESETIGGGDNGIY